MSEAPALRRLRASIGEAAEALLVTDHDILAGYETDWTRRYAGQALALARPRTTAETSAILRASGQAGVAVVAQGGNTGLVGGSVPRAGEVVLSTRDLAEIGEFDPVTSTIEAGAGVTLANLATALARHGREPGLDFGARDTATVGGVVACDAGGIRAVRHGTARARVAGLEAVLADGSVVGGTSTLLKDNAGLDLGSLMIGSEGTLGVITKVRWRAVAQSHGRVASFVGLDSIASAAELAASLRSRLPALTALEFMSDRSLELALEYLGREAPIRRRAAVYVIAEFEGGDAALEELAAAFEELGIDEAVIADERSELERLWSLRDELATAISAGGIPHKLDVGVPLARLAGFLEATEAALADHSRDAELVAFGHLGDGNVHVNVLGLDPRDTTIDARILKLAAYAGGTISAEHGIGVAKAEWLELCRSPAEIRAMHRVKQALDPDGVLNPGVGLPPAV